MICSYDNTYTFQSIELDSNACGLNCDTSEEGYDFTCAAVFEPNNF